MRRWALVIACFLSVLALVPEAQAQFNPRGFLNILTSPLRGFGRAARQRHYHAPRRSVARRSAPAVAAAAAVTTTAVAPAIADAKADAEPAVLPIASVAFWPGAHEDLIGYIFRPGEYDDKLWAHGFADIAGAILEQRLTRSASADPPALPAGDAAAEAAKICSQDGTWPDGKIAAMLLDSVGQSTLTDPQRAALHDLESAIADAVKSVRSACVAIVNAEPAARMKTMLDRLWAIRVAGYLVREPLTKFYGTLTREQKAKFERGPSAADTFGICTAASAQRLPFPQLERAIRPTADQRVAFGNLQRQSEQAALSLRASCPGKPPATPTARLDAALDRIDAITYAAGNLAPAFGSFYASLSDDQRTRLSGFGR